MHEMEDMEKTRYKREFETLVAGTMQLEEEDFLMHGEEGYRELLDNIRVHKYLANRRIPRELSGPEAVYSWFEEVYEPVARALDRAGIRKEFPHMTRGELFLHATRHWHFMKENDGSRSSARKAVLDYAARFAPSPVSRFMYRLRGQVA